VSRPIGINPLQFSDPECQIIASRIASEFASTDKESGSRHTGLLRDDNCRQERTTFRTLLAVDVIQVSTDQRAEVLIPGVDANDWGHFAIKDCPL
jgi:hypothetical protein